MESKALLKTTTKKPKVHFHFIDGLRALAALWVILFHSVIDPDKTISQFTDTLPKWFVYVVFEKGHLGVPIFFVISGFLIAYSLKNTQFNFAWFKNFVLRRLVRLSPTYYLSILITLAIGFIAAYAKSEEFAPLGHPLSVPRLIAHLFYLQDIFKLHHINDVYWTLCLEVQSYFIFGILFWLVQWIDSRWNTNRGRLFVFLPSAVIAAFYAIEIIRYEGRATIFLPIWYSFLLGIFAYWAWRKELKLLLFYFYVAILVSAGIANSSIFAIASSIVAVLLLEVARANRMGQLLNWQWLQFLGKISYSLYLTHTPVLGGIYWIVFKLFNHSVWSEFLALMLGVGGSIAFATLIWQVMEKPSIQWNKNLKFTKSSNQQASSN
ncbi:putative acyltransferase [Rivularia sp. PCC 7116]|uniref:acyltransferase family protein n=1 Tax=Rivularia sp. PCC 7116 TaxID=373994 RepID=UPI00029ED449|nr:acyltransferase [Rivularia sp. PCC 7116]AFY58416.1 putative acyltransferase [Rivularia sp. PCC 7116]